MLICSYCGKAIGIITSAKYSGRCYSCKDYPMDDSQLQIEPKESNMGMRSEGFLGSGRVGNSLSSSPAAEKEQAAYGQRLASPTITVSEYIPRGQFYFLNNDGIVSYDGAGVPYTISAGSFNSYYPAVTLSALGALSWIGWVDSGKAAEPPQEELTAPDQAPVVMRPIEV